jgi:hypothetical protein
MTIVACDLQPGRANRNISASFVLESKFSDYLIDGASAQTFR